MAEQYVAGRLTIDPQGFGLLHNPEFPAAQDGVFVSIATIRRYGLRPGDQVEGLFRWPRHNERYPSLQTVSRINDADANSTVVRRT